MRKTEIITLGCRLNTFESEVMRANARAAGLTDAIIVNTCTVTGEAERQARQTIRRLRRERPGALIVVSGCAAQIAPAKFAAMPEVDIVLGNREKLDPESFLPERLAAGDRVSDIMDGAPAPGPMVAGFEGRSRAFVQIQQGCDHRCTFCIIPFARGASRSFPVEQITGQVQRLVDGGYREVVLTGVDISSYGEDGRHAPSLGVLCKELLDRVPALQRLRLSSLDPAVPDDGIFALLADEPRLMPHLHLSMQSGNDLILKRMKRRHRREDALAFCRRAREARPDIVFGADLIAGFPTEDEAMFDDSLSLVGEAGLTFLHVFPFSPRPGTPAADMPQVATLAGRERARRLRQAGQSAAREYYETQVGGLVDILVEKNGHGYSRHYAPGRLATVARAGSIVTARVTASDGDGLIAEGV